VGKNRSVLPGSIACAIAVAVLSAAPVRAQSVVADAAASPGREALQEIVVTATKRNEDLQNVGLSITALTMEQLESKGVTQFFDYATSIPNLSFGIGAADGSLAARGVALRGIEGANTTGFYIDDTPVLETLDPHIVDVSRIEVLRGPQGTLYGAESMGGTVRIITAQPTATAFSGQVHVGGSDTQHGSGNEIAEGDVNIPLVSNVLSVRASAFYQFDSGYFDKDIGPYSAPPTQTLHDVGSMKYSGGQIALKFEPVEGLSFTPRIMYQETVQDGVPYALDDPNNLVQHQMFNIGEGGTDKWWLASFTANYDLPFGSIVSSSAYFERKTFETEDDTDVLALDLGLPNPIPSPITREIDLRRFAQEVRFASSFQGPFQMILGGFYSNSTRPRDYEWTGQGLGAATGTPNDLALSFIDSRHATESAVFGDVSYDILSNLKATAGVRWFNDTATFHQYTNGLFFGGAPSTYVAAPTSESGFTPKYLLEYKLTPNLLTYASVAKGFREGGNNIALPPGPPPGGCDQDLKNIGATASEVSTFKSDSLWNYEVGFKSSFMDHRYTLNGSGFVIEWNNIQQQISLPLCGYGVTGNSGAARSTGFELEFSGRVIPELTLGAGLGYEDARITQQGLDSPQTVGSPVYLVPGITIASNAEYERHLNATWSGFARLDYSHVGESWSANNAQVNPLKRSAYTITDLRFGVRRERYEFTAFVKNLSNEHANLGDAIMIGAQIPGQPHFVINQPRTIGVEARLRFD
jgi:outer membrane receptor protein involved in Fe transport